MSIFKLPKSPLYKGLARIFVVIAVAWTGLILFWIREEHFDMVRPDAKTVERVDRWFAEIAMLGPSYSGQFSDLPAERRSLIQKATNTGAYNINGREEKLSESEFKACKAILENGFSEQVKVTIVRTCKNIEPIKSLSGMQHSGRYISETPVWDFRGVDNLNLEEMSDFVRGIIHQLDKIQFSEGMEHDFLAEKLDKIQITEGTKRNYASGMVEKFKPSGEFTGLKTENDLALLDDLGTAHKNRWILKPLFWVASWIAPLLGLGLATLMLVELCRWIVRGFQPSAQSNP